MSVAISPHRMATLVDGFSRTPAYDGLAGALRLAIGDGRIPYDAKLPSERDLTGVLGVSRTTVARAYALLVDQGYAVARRGSGTFARVPGGRGRARDRALTPSSPATRDVGTGEVQDLVCAAASAPPGIAEAYAAAAAELPAYLGGHGYFPTALPQLAEAIAASYERQGLPTRPEQVLVTTGALSGTAVAARTLLRPGDRALVESPVYPNAVSALRNFGARIATAPVHRDGWDLDALGAALRQAAPRAAYLIPDFQNPTGHLMSGPDRATLARHLADAHVTPVVDEAHRALVLDEVEVPAPFATYAPDTITLGSASKAWWGGLRLGWVRMPAAHVGEAVEARLGLDLGAPVFEQLVLHHLLAGDGAALVAQRDRLRVQRDHLVAAVRRELPDWRFTVPAGGMVLWCELPDVPHASASQVAHEAERLGLVITAGPQFAATGGLDRFVRLPYAQDAGQLDLAVARLAQAWARVADGEGSGRSRSGSPVMVA